MHIPNADRALQVIHDSINEDGWLLNTVDPETFSTPSLPGSYSPEGQAFVIQMYAAWKDWVAHGAPGATDRTPMQFNAVNLLKELELGAHEKRMVRVRRPIQN